jgi:RNA polymerase sigma factor (TIGR02999 family)
MPALTELLNKVESGDSEAEALLLRLVYDELRRIAAARMQGEQSGQTLQPTALVHEAWMRVLATRHGGAFRDRRAFFAAFTGTMRRVLIDVARRKAAERHGGRINQQSLAFDPPESAALRGAALTDRTGEVLLVHSALERLEGRDPVAAELVNLHYFSGLSLPEVAEVLQMSRASVYRCWRFARTWLKAEIAKIAAEDSRHRGS